MNSNWKTLMIGGALLAGLSGTAAARDNVNFSFSFGVPAYSYAPPPPPVYYAPPVVYYAPVAPRVYYAPPAWGRTVYVHRGWDRGHPRRLNHR